MKTLQATAFVSLMLGSLAAQAGTPIINLMVGGEISPGVYGQVQFGNAPPPPVLYAQPMIIVRQPPDVVFEPTICMCRLVTRKIGPNIAASTTPVTGLFTL